MSASAAGGEAAGGPDGSPLRLARAVAYLLIGVALLWSPWLAGPVGDTLEPDDRYTYEAVEVTVENGTLVYGEGDGAPPDDGLAGIDCLARYSRLCGLEVDQLDGNATVRAVNPIEREVTPYVALSGEFYERTRARTGGRIAFGLRPVSARTVLAAVSVPVEDTRDPAAIRRIVRDGTATIGHELAAPGRVVRLDGSYYAFDLDRAVTPRGDGPVGVVALGSAVGVILGLWSLRRGWIHHDRWRAGRAGDG